MGLVAGVDQYSVCLVNLDPTVGHEIKKTRPCVVISPDEMNRYIATVIVAPMTTQSHNYPTRVPLAFQGKNGWIVLDQIRTIDKSRIVARIGKLDIAAITAIKNVLNIMLVE
jgi:mRNA interferase MazF